MNIIYQHIPDTFDRIQQLWENEQLERKISVLLVIFFLFGVVVIEAKRQGLVPWETLAIPDNHFRAISWAFTVVLILEVIGLILTLPQSFSRSVGKQFEILSLILMRNAFKELSTMAEPITFEENKEAVLFILSNGFGALAIFALLGCYYLLQKKEPGEHYQPEDLATFINAKKGIALVLLGLFIFMGIRSVITEFFGHTHPDFLHQFYTLLILTDILVVLLSQCCQPSFYAMFRNSGFALSTLIIRLALAAPQYYNVLLGITAAIFAILLTVVSNLLFNKR